jgi:hypothetical protein
VAIFYSNPYMLDANSNFLFFHNAFSSTIDSTSRVSRPV